MRNKLFVLLAALVLVASALACALGGGEPGVSNIRMTTDVSGATATTEYSPGDDFFVFFDVNAIETGTPFEARWYAMDIEGEDPNTPFQTISYNLEQDVSTVYFQLFSDVDWPTGTYRVEIYMSGQKVGEQQFSVR